VHGWEEGENSAVGVGEGGGAATAEGIHRYKNIGPLYR